MADIPIEALKRIKAAKENKSGTLDLSGIGLTDENMSEVNSILSGPEPKNLTSLDVSRNGLGSLPEWVGELKNLTLLDVSGNGLQSMPEWMRELRNLTSLHVGRNSLGSLPEWMGELKNLTSLDVSMNELASLPEWMRGLKNLNSLNVRMNRLGSLPEWIGELKNLASLDVSMTVLESLPEWMGELKNLTSLNVGNNGLGNLPEWMGELKNLTSLDVSNNSLGNLPEWMGELKNLTSLGVGNNSLGSLPEWMGELKNLTSLDVGWNSLRSLPEWMGELKNLTSLDVGSNSLGSLPEWMGELKNLTSLDVGWNNLGSLPEWMGELKNLSSLNVSHNELGSLPEWMGALKSLTWLDLGWNCLESLPEWMGALKNLTWLNANNNLFAHFPKVIYKLSSLRALWLGSYSHTESKNTISELSREILLLENLRWIDLNENPIVKPPLEIVEKGIEAIRQYFRQLDEEGLDYLYEAKLLIVGEGGAGKTSLAKKIINPKYELVHDEVSTQGIEVLQWKFPATNKKSFQANIWDFGGQEIYHATHQFFLTKRSLYILVADTRKEDTDFYYWLNAVELLSENSPILIIKNEKQDRHRDINEGQLRKQFGNLNGTLSLNLKTGKGLAEALKLIRQQLLGLDHVGSPLPKTWVDVRTALEADVRDHITVDEYFEICEKHGFRDQKDKLQLSGYLHDLGVCLYFQEDSILKKTVILNPSWGTDAVYAVLDNPEVIKSLGKFDRADLAAIWHEEKYAQMRDELLQLMVNFKLCYKIPDSDRYIAPQLLSVNQPNYEWDENENIVLRYSYPDFMPKGLLTQFIVATHKRIAEQSFVWRTGVILEHERSRAEVIEYYEKREIRIRVSGVNKRDLMTIVTYELENIHHRYRDLNYEMLIPCNCLKCNESQTPSYYPLETLKHFIGNKQETIQCQKSFEAVKVRGLIDDEVVERSDRLSKERFVFGDNAIVTFQEAQVIRSLIGGDYMGDVYKTGQAGAVGPNSHAHDMNFNQIWNQFEGSISLSDLAAELTRLRHEMKKGAVEPEHDLAVAEIAKAEKVASEGNGPKTMEYLKSAGKWALDVGTKIGTTIAVEALEKATGLKVN